MGSIDRQDSTPQLLNRLRMRQIALILAIREHRTLRGAAAHLGLSQPAATKMLHELEDALDARLFERVGRGLQLNDAGERVTAYFEDLRGSMEALNRELGELRQGSAGRLAVGSIMAASPGRLTQALLAMKRERPLLAIEVAVDTSDRLLAQLREGLIEVMVGRMADEHPSEYLFRPIDDESLVIVAALEHPLMAEGRRRPRLSLAMLRDFGWVLQPPGSPMRTLINQEFRAQGLALPRGLIETGSMLTTINLVRGSNMLAVLPTAVASSYVEHGMLGVLPYRLQRPLEAYGSIVHRNRPLSTIARQFQALLHRG